MYWARSDISVFCVYDAIYLKSSITRDLVLFFFLTSASVTLLALATCVLIADVEIRGSSSERKKERFFAGMANPR